MMRYSVKRKDLIFVKGYGFLSFTKDMSENIGKSISKSLSGRYSPGMLVMRQKLLDHAKKFTADALKASSKRIIQKTAEATDDLISNKIAVQITKLQKIHNKLIQKQLEITMIKKYLKKNMYLYKKDNKLLMN